MRTDDSSTSPLKMDYDSRNHEIEQKEMQIDEEKKDSGLSDLPNIANQSTYVSEPKNLQFRKSLTNRDGNESSVDEYNNSYLTSYEYGKRGQMNTSQLR